MTSPKMFKTISNGEIVLRLYNPITDNEGVFRIFREIYMKESNIFRAFDMDKSEDINTHLEFAKFINTILKEDISVIAHHLPSNEIVGIAMNMIHWRPQPGRLSPYEELRNELRSKELRKMCDYNISQDRKLNLFDRYNTDCVFELKYLATHPDFRQKGIAYNLVECSIEIAKNLSFKMADLREIKPTLVYGKFGSKYTEKIGKKLGSVVIESTPINALEIDGIPITSKVPAQHIYRHDRGVTLLKL